jgi:hypothetical protein
MDGLLGLPNTSVWRAMFAATPEQARFRLGLHITLFGAQILTTRFVEEDYGLGPSALDR